MRKLLTHAGDLERLLSRLTTNRAGARELLALKTTLLLIPSLRDLLKDGDIFKGLINNLKPQLRDMR